MEAPSKNVKEYLCGSRLHAIGSEGSMPPSKGIPSSTSLLASNTSRGLERMAQALALYGRIPSLSLTPLLEGSYRTPVEGQLSIP
jgi:hypothetical protein